MIYVSIVDRNFVDSWDSTVLGELLYPCSDGKHNYQIRHPLWKSCPYICMDEHAVLSSYKPQIKERVHHEKNNVWVNFFLNYFINICSHYNHFRIVENLNIDCVSLCVCVCVCVGGGGRCRSDGVSCLGLCMFVYEKGLVLGK